MLQSHVLAWVCLWSPLMPVGICGKGGLSALLLAQTWTGCPWLPEAEILAWSPAPRRSPRKAWDMGIHLSQGARPPTVHAAHSGCGRLEAAGKLKLSPAPLPLGSSRPPHPFACYLHQVALEVQLFLLMVLPLSLEATDQSQAHGQK